MVLSLDAEARRVPHGLYAREFTRLVCPRRATIDAPPFASHIHTRLLSEAQATFSPSGEKVRKTQGKGMLSVCSKAPVMHHNSTSLSLDADAKRALSGEYATEHTARR